MKKLEFEKPVYLSTHISIKYLNVKICCAHIINFHKNNEVLAKYTFYPYSCDGVCYLLEP